MLAYTIKKAIKQGKEARLHVHDVISGEWRIV